MSVVKPELTSFIKPMADKYFAWMVAGEIANFLFSRSQPHYRKFRKLKLEMYYPGTKYRDADSGTMLIRIFPEDFVFSPEDMGNPDDKPPRTKNTFMKNVIGRVLDDFYEREPAYAMRQAITRMRLQIPVSIAEYGPARQTRILEILSCFVETYRKKLWTATVDMTQDFPTYIAKYWKAEHLVFQPEQFTDDFSRSVISVLHPLNQKETQPCNVTPPTRPSMSKTEPLV